MTTVDWVTVLSVLLAPFTAVFAQRAIEVWWEKRQRRLQIFKSLMATRGSLLSPQHVQALNMIELEFANKEHKAIREAWREYHTHLNEPQPQQIDEREKAFPVWIAKCNDLLVALLQQMARHLKYDFDPVLIKKGCYTPAGHAQLEEDIHLIRKLLLKLLSGEGILRVASVPEDAEAAKHAEKFRKGFFSILDGSKPLRVKATVETEECPPSLGS